MSAPIAMCGRGLSLGSLLRVITCDCQLLHVIADNCARLHTIADNCARLRAVARCDWDITRVSIRSAARAACGSDVRGSTDEWPGSP
nr:MAG TPA: hypothetical protein [Caudoviricetes sp.]